MVRVSLGLGIIATVAGLMAIGFGIPIQAFGLGNLLISAGATVFSAGLIVIALSMLLRAIEQLSEDLRRPLAPESTGSHAPLEHRPLAPAIERPVAPPHAPEWPPAPLPPRGEPAYDERPEPRRAPMPPRSGWPDDSTAEPAAPPSPRPPGAPPPRLEREAIARPRLPGRAERPPREQMAERPQPAPEPEHRREPAAYAEQRDDQTQEPRIDPYAPPERRRVFGWTRRSKERREDAAAGAGREAEPPFGAPAGSAAPGPAHAGAADDRDIPRAPVRRPPPHGTPGGRGEQQAQPVEVLKQGTVDGMAYTLYTDGSIDAEFPEGRIRFSSIEELRQHLEAQE